MERVKGIEPSSQVWKAHLDVAESAPWAARASVSISQAGKLLGIGWETAHEILPRAVQRGLGRRQCHARRLRPHNRRWLVHESEHSTPNRIYTSRRSPERATNK